MTTNYSVLMSVYFKESPKHLRESINSILDQSHKSNDFVIVKDGPLSKELDDLLNEYKKNYDMINIHSLPQNVGLGEALNKGLIVCKNEFIMRMDSDDISKNDRAVKLLKYIKDGNYDIVGSFIAEFENNIKNVVSEKKMPLSYEDVLLYARRRNPFNHPSVMYRKSVILKIGSYRNDYIRAEDVEMFIRLLCQGYKGSNINESLVYYRVDKNMYKRRKSYLSIKNYVRTIFNSYKNGFSSFFDYLYVLVTQIFIFIIPAFILKIIYRNIIRKR